MNPPAALHGAMSRDRKPFTYTPGGLDLSEIKSERMAARLMRNAMNQGVPELPQIQSPPMPSTPIAVPNFNCLPVQVFPTFNLPANPKSLLRTRSNPSQPRDPPVQRVLPPQTFVNNSRATEATQYDTFNKNTPTNSQTNNNRPASMYEYGTPANTMNYGSDGYSAAFADNKYNAEYFQMPKNIYNVIKSVAPPVEINKRINGSQIMENSEDVNDAATLTSFENSKYQVYTEDKVKTQHENKEILIENLSKNKEENEIKAVIKNNENMGNATDADSNSDQNILDSNKETIVVIPAEPTKTIYNSGAITAKPLEDLTGLEKEKKELKVVQVIKKENEGEEQNGTSEQNGSNDTSLRAVIKLPTKKSAAKTETKVEVLKKTLPDGSIEEVKKTITKTTIDGKTEIKTKTETTIIPKDDDDEEEVEEVEEQEEDNGELQEEAGSEVKKSAGGSEANLEENGQDNIIKTEEKSETVTTTSKKVTVVQDDEENQNEEEVVEEETEEVEPITVILKKPEENPEQKEPVDHQEEQEEVEEVEEEPKKEGNVAEEDDNEEVTIEEVENDDELIEKVENKKDKIDVKEKEVEEEEVEEEEEYQEAEEKEVEKTAKVDKITEEEKDIEEKRDDEGLDSAEEEVELEKENESVKEEVEMEKEEAPSEKEETPSEDVKAPVEEEEIKEYDEKQEQIQQITEEKQEIVLEKEELKEEKQNVPEEKLEPRVIKIEQTNVPLREPSVPLEKVEDVEIKPIGAGDFITKTHTENTEIITNVTEKPTGLLTEFNRIENIVTVNRTTKTLDQSYDASQGVPTVKTYFSPLDKTSLASSPYQPVYPPQPQQPTERRHSLLLERLSVERQMPADIYQNNSSYQYSNQNVEEQRQWSQEPQAEVVTVSNVKPSQITNQQWYQQRDNSVFDTTPSPQSAAPSWTQPKTSPQQVYQPQPQYKSPTPQPQYKSPTPQPQPQLQSQYQPSYTENVQESQSNTYQSTYSSISPKASNWSSKNKSCEPSPKSPIPTIVTPSQPDQYSSSFLKKDSSESYQQTTQFSPGSYVPPPWEQDSTYVAPQATPNFYQPPPQTSTYTPAAKQGWKPTPTSKFSKTTTSAYIPPKPNQSFVKPVNNVEPPRLPGRKTYYSEYERRYITVPEYTYIPAETKFQPQPDPSPKYFYDNNEPAEAVEPQWRKELREFTEKTQTQTETNVKPPWEQAAPNTTYTQTPTWSQTVRPRSWRERSFESEFVSQEWPKTNTLGRGRPLSSYGKESIPERTRGVSVDRYNPNSYQAPLAAEHPPVQTHTHIAPAPLASSYHNPNVPAYHARASAEPREHVSYQQPRHIREARASPFQSRSFKYLQWITGTED